MSLNNKIDFQYEFLFSSVYYIIPPKITLGLFIQNYYFGAISKIILGKGSANARRRYDVTSSLISWAHTQDEPCVC